MRLYRDARPLEISDGKSIWVDSFITPIEITEEEIYDIIMNTEDDAVSNDIQTPLNEVYKLQAKAILTKLTGE